MSYDTAPFFFNIPLAQSDLPPEIAKSNQPKAAESGDTTMDGPGLIALGATIRVFAMAGI